MTEVASLYVTLTAHTGRFSSAMQGAAAEGEKFSATVTRGTKQLAAFAAVGGAAVIGVGVKSLEMATRFQAATERIRTQAGASQAEVEKVRKTILSLGGKTAQGPQALAEAMYHIESAGFRGKVATDLLRQSYQLADVSGAKLEDTANGLVGVMQSGWVTGVNAAAKATAMLNAIVGAGNMRMQDLNGALSTGIAASARTFGVSMQSAGAALALMTDMGSGAQESATRLRMSFSLMGAPSKQAAKYLHDVGLSSADAGKRISATQAILQKAGVTTTQISNDLRKPDGLLVALQDLKTHMISAGLTANEQGALISRAFGGGRSGAAIMTMYNNLDLLKQKYEQVGAGISAFAADVAATHQTLQYRWKAFQGFMETLMVNLGTRLIPIATRALGALSKAMDWLGRHKQVVEALGGALAGVLAAGLAAATAAAWAFMAPFLAIAVPIGVVSGELVYLYQHSTTWRHAIDDLTSTLKSWGKEIVRNKGLLKAIAEMIAVVCTAAVAAWVAKLAWGAGRMAVSFGKILLGTNGTRDAFTRLRDKIVTSTAESTSAVEAGAAATDAALASEAVAAETTATRFGRAMAAMRAMASGIGSLPLGVLGLDVASVGTAAKSVSNVWSLGGAYGLDQQANRLAALQKTGTPQQQAIISQYAGQIQAALMAARPHGFWETLTGKTHTRQLQSVLNQVYAALNNPNWRPPLDTTRHTKGFIGPTIAESLPASFVGPVPAWERGIVQAVHKAASRNPSPALPSDIQAALDSINAPVQALAGGGGFGGGGFGGGGGTGRRGHRHALALMHRRLAAHRHHITQELNHEGHALTLEGHHIAAYQKFAKAHPGSKQAAQMFARDFAEALRNDRAAHGLLRNLMHDPLATKAERHRAAMEAHRADTLLARLWKAGHPKHPQRHMTEHARRLSAHQAILRELPSYLALTRAHSLHGVGGLSTFSFGGRSEVGSGSALASSGSVIIVPAPVVNVKVLMDNKAIAHEVVIEASTKALRHERRNVNNGLSRYTRR